MTCSCVQQLRLALHTVGFDDHIQKIRVEDFLQDFDIGHDAVSADNSGRILDGREERDLVIERNYLVIVDLQTIAISFDFLGPSDQ